MQQREDRRIAAATPVDTSPMAMVNCAGLPFASPIWSVTPAYGRRDVVVDPAANSEGPLPRTEIEAHESWD